MSFGCNCQDFRPIAQTVARCDPACRPVIQFQVAKERTRRPSVPLTEEMLEKLEARAKKERRTLSNLLACIVEDALEKDD